MSVIRTQLKRLLRQIGLTVRRVDNTQFFNFEALLYYQLAASRGFKFVQVGACDGVTFDPIYEFVTRNRQRVHGLVLEPLPDLFETLQRNYQHCPNITAVNFAIHNSAESMPLYRVDPDKLHDLPEHAIAIASFDPGHHLRSGIPEDCIVSQTVCCLSLGMLLDKHGWNEIDLLLIDTEGYDAEILLGIDFQELTPTIIRFEHGLRNGTMSTSVFQEVVDRLHSHGYELIVEESDAVAWQRDLIIGSLAVDSPYDVKCDNACS